jgi:hypothetical protein
MTENLKQPMETAPYGAAKAAFGGKREADGGSEQAFAFGDSEGLEAVKMRSTELSELARSVLCSVEVAVDAAQKAAARISEAWDGVQQVSSSLVAPKPQPMQPLYTDGDDQTPKAIAEAAYALREMANAITHAVTHWRKMAGTSPPGSTTSPGMPVHHRPSQDQMGSSWIAAQNAREYAALASEAAQAASAAARRAIAAANGVPADRASMIYDEAAD